MEEAPQVNVDLTIDEEKGVITLAFETPDEKVAEVVKNTVKEGLIGVTDESVITVMLGLQTIMKVLLALRFIIKALLEKAEVEQKGNKVFLRIKL